MRMTALSRDWRRHLRILRYWFDTDGAETPATQDSAGDQRIELPWAAHHRNHHQNADTPLDPHSPGLRGFFWSHTGGGS
jgi:hypothetical protein